MKKQGTRERGNEGTRGRRPRLHSRPGFIAADILGGLMIIGLLTMSVAGTMYQHRQAMRALAHQKEAVALAEQAVASMQSGLGLPDDSGQTMYELAPVEGGEPLDLHVWVKLVVTHGAARTELVAVVPRKFMEALK